MLSQVEIESECILWTGYIRPNGYGVLGRNTMAHRAAWELVNGPIPEGLTIDHLCGTRACVNVLHMEVVTRGENAARAARREVCKSGHELSGANLYVSPRGKRQCRACKREWYDRYGYRKPVESC